MGRRSGLELLFDDGFGEEEKAGLGEEEPGFGEALGEGEER